MTFNKLLMYNEYELVINYFLKRDLQNLGFIKYKHVKGIIKYCVSSTDYEARKIFNIITRLGYFERRKICNTRRSFEYRFINPYVEEEEKPIMILYFD